MLDAKPGSAVLFDPIEVMKRRFYRDTHLSKLHWRGGGLLGHLPDQNIVYWFDRSWTPAWPLLIPTAGGVLLLSLVSLRGPRDGMREQSPVEGKGRWTMWQDSPAPPPSPAATVVWVSEAGFCSAV